MVERVHSLFTNNIRDSKYIAIKNLERAKKVLPEFDYRIYISANNSTTISVMFKAPTPCKIMRTPYTLYREEYVIGNDWSLVKYVLERLTQYSNYSFKWQERDFNEYLQVV